jgi:hypothetical protein
MTTIFRLRDRTEGFTGQDRQLATNRRQDVCPAEPAQQMMMSFNSSAW